VLQLVPCLVVGEHLLSMAQVCVVKIRSYNAYIHGYVEVLQCVAVFCILLQYDAVENAFCKWHRFVTCAVFCEDLISMKIYCGYI